jgi:hypothetical protein
MNLKLCDNGFRHPWCLLVLFLVKSLDVLIKIFYKKHKLNQDIFIGLAAVDRATNQRTQLVFHCHCVFNVMYDNHATTILKSMQQAKI